MERMQLEYNKAAQEAGVYIVSACGFDSIPADLGIVFTQQKFGGEINTIETYLKCWTTGNTKGSILNYGTWESAVYGVGHKNELQALRSKLYPTKLPEFTPKLKSKYAKYFKYFFIKFIYISIYMNFCLLQNIT